MPSTIAPVTSPAEANEPVSSWRKRTSAMPPIAFGIRATSEAIAIGQAPGVRITSW
jgi:hypothetical protein